MPKTFFIFYLSIFASKRSIKTTIFFLKNVNEAYHNRKYFQLLFNELKPKFATMQLTTL